MIGIPRRLLRMAFVLLLGAAGARAEPLRALVLSGMNNHDWTQTTPALQRVLEASGRFEVEVSNDPAAMTAAGLAAFDVVVSNWNNWPSEDRIWGAEAENALLSFVRGGKGFVVVHAACACFGDWPEFQQLVGATWAKGQTAHGAYHEFPVTIADKRHPVARGMADFRQRDELWHKMAVQPTAHVLCTAFSAADQGGTGQAEPVAWATTLGDGRGFNFALGHDAAAMRGWEGRLLFLRGCEWAATGQATVTAPLDAEKALAAIVRYERHAERSRLAAVEELAQHAAMDPALREQLVPRMTALLRSGEATDDARVFVLQQLSVIGSAREVPDIAALLGDDTVGDAALAALERIPGPQAAQALLEAVAQVGGPRRIGAINALGERREPKAAGALIRLLTETDADVVTAATAALGRIGGAAAIEALKRLPASPTQGEALLACAERAAATGNARQAEDLYGLLGGPGRSRQVREAAFAGAIACAGAGRSAALLAALRSDDAARQAGAVRALRELADNVLAQQAATELPGLAPPVQVQVVSALADTAATDTVSEIAKLVASSDPVVSLAAVRALGRLRDARAWPVLLDALRAAPQGADGAPLEEALARVCAQIAQTTDRLPLVLADEAPAAQPSVVRMLGQVPHPAALQEVAARIDDAALGAEAGLAAVRIAEQLPPEQKSVVQAALEKVLANSPDGRLRTRAKAVLLGLGIPVEVTRSVALENPGPNLALGATASSPDNIDSDGAASGDQAGIDGDPNTYWDEVNDQALYCFRVTFAAPTAVSALRIMGHQHHMHSPKDFDILCDDQVVLSVEDAWYEANQFAVRFPRTTCTALELRITGGYGPSPAIRELEILDPQG